MQSSFDADAFLGCSLTIIANSKGKSFAVLAEELQRLQRSHPHWSDLAARRSMRKVVNRWMVMFAVDADEELAVVDPLYRAARRAGFTYFGAEVSCALDYAYYCADRQNLAKGIVALARVKKCGATRRDASEGEFAWRERLEEAICNFRAQQDDSERSSKT